MNEIKDLVWFQAICPDLNLFDMIQSIIWYD